MEFWGKLLANWMKSSIKEYWQAVKHFLGGNFVASPDDNEKDGKLRAKLSKEIGVYSDSGHDDDEMNQPLLLHCSASQTPRWLFFPS